MNHTDNNHKEIEQLRRENRALLRQIEQLNQKLMESEAFKSHFLSNVTNEIVNPFASVIGLSQQITELPKEACDKAMELAELIHSEASSLDFQLRNIFVAARLEAGEEIPEPSKFDVEEVVREVIKKIRHEADKKRVQIKTKWDLQANQFISDRNMLHMILLNLLSNAINFSTEDKTVWVTIRCKTDRLVMEIRDEGIGMTPEESERIFDRFHRANPRIQSVTPGSGLGLAVVEGLLFLLNGEIKVKTAPGKGTTIQVSLPEMDARQITFEDDLFFDEDEGNEESF